MRHVSIGFGLLFAFVGGCATAAIANNSVFPSARAQEVRKWDYLCLEEDHAEPVMERTKAAGRQGWELVTSGNGIG